MRGPAEEIARTIGACPSGAVRHFTATREDTMTAEEQKTTITLAANGPLLVKGPVTVLDDKGTAIPTKEGFALCRCGGSSNKPFCDGTHRRIGFTTHQ